VAGSCEDGNEPSDLIKSEKCLDQLSCYKLLKKKKKRTYFMECVIYNLFGCRGTMC
jgi:hypothetical protein